MANVLIEENTMSAIGNAIRAKTKKTDLIYPADMAEEIDGIVGGIPAEIITRELTEYSNSDVEKIGEWAFVSFPGLESVDFQNVKTIGESAFFLCESLTSINFPNAKDVLKSAFCECTALTTASFPVATSIGESAFSNCTALTTASFPVATSIGENAFAYCNVLTTASFPAATSIGGYAFSNCTALTTASFPVAARIGSYAFLYDKELKSLILRNPDAVCTLSNKNAFNNSSILNKTGYIYVPSALIEDYKVATNWSTYATQFRALEDYTVDGTITGELDETKI